MNQLDINAAMARVNAAQQKANSDYELCMFMTYAAFLAAVLIRKGGIAECDYQNAAKVAINAPSHLFSEINNLREQKSKKESPISTE